MDKQNCCFYFFKANNRFEMVKSKTYQTEQKYKNGICKNLKLYFLYNNN